MNAFLKQAAAHYMAAIRQGKYCFVFPNRRSLVFFKKYLGDELREHGGGKPLLLPPLYPVNDFFLQLGGGQPAERLTLLLELYRCYRTLNPQAEPLDEFVFWGETLLADFDDIDKYLVDARGVLCNVTEFKGMQDSFDYLTPTQQSALERFLAHFRGLQPQPDGEDVQSRFVRLWNLLYPLYQSFRESLREKGLQTEGGIYRSLAERLKGGASVKDLLEAAFPDAERFVFVGLNAFTGAEHLLLSRMRDAGLAEFVWDFESPEIRDPANQSSRFLAQNLKDFPQAFPLEKLAGKPQVTVISIPSSVGQAKLAPRILQEIGSEANPVETAFVLPDESLLLPLLHAIPPAYDAVNVTMGYPMAGSALYTLLDALGQLQLKLRQRPDGWYAYHRPVREVFTSGIFKALLSEEEQAVVSKVQAAARYYVPLSDLQGGPVLKLLFRAVVTEPDKASAEQNHAMEQYLADVAACVGARLAAGGQMPLELDFARSCHTTLTLLQQKDLELLPATHLNLVKRLLEGISVPFKGEPLQGLQVMGPLETRALDFRNVVILSANEGMFPRRSLRSSFIPPELRKGFGLPTYEHQDAVWAYYFYRLLQRAERVWLIYDSRTEGLRGGEESRFIKQLGYHFGWPLERRVAVAAMHPTDAAGSIPKTEEDVRKIREGHLSASTLQSYLHCPAQFYYKVVQELESEEDLAESLDQGMLGRVFHKVMEELYDLPMVTPQDLAAFRADKPRLKQLIRAEVMEQMHSPEVSGRNLVLEEVLLDYVLRTLEHDARLLGESGSEGFRILGRERFMETRFEGFRILGFVDRIDSYKPGEVRIVDYKTGRVEDEDLLITDDNAAAVVEKLFGPVNKGRPKIALQLFVYDLFAKEDPALRGQQVINSIYSTARLYTGALPDVPASPEFLRLTRERLKELLREMTDTAVPFRRTDQKDSCAWCDFKDICGR